MKGENVPKFTDQQVEAAMAEYAAWKKRVGRKAVDGLTAFSDVVDDAGEAFAKIEDSVEFLPDEKAQILGAMASIWGVLKNHAKRVNGYQDGMGAALEKYMKRKHGDNVVDGALTFSLGHGCQATILGSFPKNKKAW
jgi:hypothetical protein